MRLEPAESAGRMVPWDGRLRYFDSGTLAAIGRRDQGGGIKAAGSRRRDQGGGIKAAGFVRGKWDPFEDGYPDR
ncbi:hypothetical protein ACQPZF_16435 [Actinosynnema sp. CS-041913]|uniref:hypothetical protein n=1 Tax=Actinosynnema sp. CS-041913 TaxID=3239917 RepID=UPI003D8EB036